MAANVIHITTVHAPFDPRVFRKQCKSLREAGYAVTLLACHDKDEDVEGIHLRALRCPRPRLLRMLVGGAKCFLRVRRARPAVCQFHDPELIPVGLLLRLLGTPVIYDVHEDYVTAMATKSYLPAPARWAIRHMVGGLEAFVARFFHIIIAEKYYQRRFPKACRVLNYPLIDPDEARIQNTPPADGLRLIYTGNITEHRGALVHSRLPQLHPQAELHMVGRCASPLAQKMREQAGDGASRLHIEGEGTYVDFSRIKAYYEMANWSVGLALFPPTPHYMEKELTKFFEYMAAGIPVLCSDFPAWKQLIEGEGVGRCVSPDDEDQIREALAWFQQHPAEAMAMGQRGQELARRKYAWASQADNLLALYQRVLKG